MTYVQLMQIVFTAILGCYGFTPTWCVDCGNMSVLEDPTGTVWEQVWTDWDNLYRCPYCDGYTEIQPLN